MPLEELLERRAAKISSALKRQEHVLENVLGSLRKRVTRQLTNFCEHHAFVSCVEPQKVHEALEDSDWLEAMHDELNNFERNKVWSLVPRPTENHNVIGTKWIFKNKQDANGVVIRNKARLVAHAKSLLMLLAMNLFACCLHMHLIMISNCNKWM